jgi:hypothetical protein
VEPKKCPVCPAVIKDVECHMKNCHTGEMMTCSACPYTSRRKPDIDAHFRKVHTDLNKETCPVCGDMFKGLKLHLERTKCGTGRKAEATIPCPEGCPKMFTLESAMKKHIRHVHLQIKNKVCPFCEYKTYSRFNLNLHVTKMHQGKKMEKQQCLYCYKTPFALDYHMQTYHHDKIFTVDKTPFPSDQPPWTSPLDSNIGMGNNREARIGRQESARPSVNQE